MKGLFRRGCDADAGRRPAPDGAAPAIMLVNAGVLGWMAWKLALGFRKQIRRKQRLATAVTQIGTATLP